MPSTAPSPLPISVIIPTRNSMDKLPRHVAHPAALFARCAEIIHCDSHSTDATKPYLASQLSQPGFRQVDHPPGLYQSWNFAIQQCSQPFIYFSTVGDEIGLAGLQQLLDLAEKTEADVVLSPPGFMHEDGSPAPEVRWPLDHLIHHHSVNAPGLVPNHLVFTEAVIHAPDGILGSSHSCLYRASFLKPRPFPLGFHGACDSVWALQNLPDARTALLPAPISTFLLHEKSYESHGLLNAQIAILVREQLQKILAALPSQTASTNFSAILLASLISFNNTALALARENNALILQRKKFRLFWPLIPGVWQTRAHRNRHRLETRRKAEQLRQQLSSAKN